MKKVFSIVGCVAVAAAITASALPAKRGLLTIDQPDGSSIQVQLIGDEFTHCYLTPDNHVLLPDNDGVLSYAQLDAAGRPVASAVKASNIDNRTAAENAFISRLDRTAIKKAVLSLDSPRRSAARSAAQRIPQSGIGKFTGNFPTKGDIKGLVVLVEYTDVKFTTENAKEYFTRQLHDKNFSDNGATGSACDYFLSASNGQFRPQFDVYGPITLANKQSYYGGNDAWGSDRNPEDMVIEAIKALDAEVDFAQYDNDGDGYLDNVYVFYAGRGEADGGSANTVWPHSWDLTSAGKAFNVDGVTVDRYACSNEIIVYASGKRGPDGIGTFVHEFSHVMGLPDLYHTTQSVYYTPCNWSVMDYGPYNNDSRTPPTYSAYERNAMGWVDPIVITGPMSIELENIHDSNQCCIIPTPIKNEFFLLENRQQVGWDKYLPGHGMLIWHIDYKKTVFDNNVVNNTRTHQYVDIEEANNNPDGSNMSVMAGWAFPGTSMVTSFTDDTKPSMKTWAGKGLGLPLTDIAESYDGIITFDVDGGASQIAAPEALHAAMLDNGFEARWEAVDGATDYLLTVSQLTPGTFGNLVANMGTGSTLKLPEGWKASTGAVYTTTGYYGNDAPSLKLSTDQAYLTTSTVVNDITRLSFWYRNVVPSSSQSLSSVDILGSADGNEWKNIHTIAELATSSGGTVFSLDMPEGIHAVRILYNKASGGGNLALDDVTIEYGGMVATVLPDYNEVSTGGQTSFAVTKLVDGVKDYRYYVRATDGTAVSRKSNDVDVEVVLGVEDITIGGIGASVTVSDRHIHIDGITRAANVTVIDTTGRVVASHRAATGSVTLPVNTRGIYIVAIDGRATKVVVK